MRARRQGARNLALAAAGAGFMLGLALAVNPGHYGAIGSVVGAGLAIGMATLAFRAFRGG
ncbi:MAG: hypothetical protein O6851_03755 [Gemmatimonadetes bacterium]|nr:hypothetical protein [Gemmatimonadota bacterium]